MDDKNDTKQEIILPFEEVKFNFGEWVYDHQDGVLISVVIYLILTFIFAFARITIEKQVALDGIAIEIDYIEIEELERERDELMESIEMLEKQEETEPIDIENAISNEQGAEDASIEFNEIQEMLDAAAEREQQRLAQIQATYEQGLADIAAMKEEAALAAAEALAQAEREALTQEGMVVQGNVTVSYSIINPIRHAQRLIVPSYTCKGGGEVVISITLNQAGEVTSAKVMRGGDECMQQAAINSALNSLFDINHKAATRQSGKITYRFVPQ
ncbi:MAG: hypothetical protein SNF68_02620 [Rikenellaceae bacterium]